MKYPLVRCKTVLVTGCSSGIGEAAARVLRDRGWTVAPTARKPGDLDRLRAAGFDPIALDVADEASVAAAADAVLARFGEGLGGVVNNAGYGQPGALEDVPRSAMRQQFETNVFGLQDLTNRLIPQFRRQGWGRIVNISSVVGRLSLPFFGWYSASKFALEALSDALRIELGLAGISVSLVEPGPIVTRFRERSATQADEVLDFSASTFAEAYAHELERRRSRSNPEDRFALPPEAVAGKIAHALESARPRTRYPVTLPAHLGPKIKALLPDRVVDRMMLSRWTRRAKRNV